MSRLRLDPMPGSRGKEKVENSVFWIPIFKPGLFHLHTRELGEVLPRERRHLVPKLNASQLGATPRQIDRGLTGPAPNFNHIRLRSEFGQPPYGIKQLRRISGPRPVVKLGVLVKSRSPPSSLLR